MILEGPTDQEDAAGITNSIGFPDRHPSFFVARSRAVGLCCVYGLIAEVSSGRVRSFHSASKIRRSYPFLDVNSTKVRDPYPLSCLSACVFWRAKRLMSTPSNRNSDSGSAPLRIGLRLTPAQRNTLIYQHFSHNTRLVIDQPSPVCVASTRLDPPARSSEQACFGAVGVEGAWGFPRARAGHVPRTPSQLGHSPPVKSCVTTSPRPSRVLQKFTKAGIPYK